MKNDKIVLKNHGWEKQQTPKTKKGLVGRETHQNKFFHGSKGSF